MRGIWPAKLDEADRAAAQQRTLVAQRTLAHRALPGIFVYLALGVVYGLAAGGDPTSLRVTIAATAALLVLGVSRLVLHVTGRRLMEDHPARWRWWFGGLAIASILVWDGFASIELYHRSLDPMSVMLVVASAGLRASAAHSLAPDLRIHRIYASVSRLPMLVTLLVVGGWVAHVLFFLLGVQSLYSLALGRQLNAEFWEAVATNETLVRRTAALDDKTRTLERANAALTAEIAARQRIEVELRLAQKLESVGRLAAGIAHEINTPLQSVVGNVKFASDGVKDLLALIAAYRAEQALDGDRACGERATRITAAEHAADLGYLVDNLPQSLDMALEGVARTATIVRSIKAFARPDDVDMAPIDLNRAVEATLAIARHEYAAIADVVTELGELPPVVCHAGEINQVVLNLIVNAAQAIEGAARPGDPRGRITVRTRRVADSAEVAVSDTGGGIPPDIRDRVFDPFFTTKEIGKGTGQGLAIARSVITRHDGEISFDTELGRGTTFVLRIPLRRARTASQPSPPSA
jgi:signal transduction histidine kinase